MTPSRPYLIRAIYQWIVDNELTPYIVINAHGDAVQVPEEFVDADGTIVLNVSPAACRGLHFANDRIVFSARFSGIAKQIFAPPQAVIAVYAKENGRGMVFSDEDDDISQPPPESTPPDGGKKLVETKKSGSSAKSNKGKPHLRVVK